MLLRGKFCRVAKVFCYISNREERKETELGGDRSWEEKQARALGGRGAAG